jgi:subtilisin family serine protease
MEAAMTTTSPDQEYSAGTVDNDARETSLFAAEGNLRFVPAGEKTGHGAEAGAGTVAWLPAPDYEMQVPQAWPPGPGRSPVIALLDCGVVGHSWLPGADASPPFVRDAGDNGWPGPDDEPPLAGGDDRLDYGSHLIHATFIAGLIRLGAPNAQVLSVRVMDNKGKAKQSDVVKALTWLADNAHDVPVDIVLMAFGRQADPGDKDLDDLRKAVLRLSPMPIVASAGNDGSDRTVFPAAFAAEEGMPVVSVGAFTTPTERAPYSNYGPWVREWSKGTNVISISPLTTFDLDSELGTERTGSGSYTAATTGNGYAWWSGTSFAAAHYAAELASQMSAG